MDGPALWSPACAPNASPPFQLTMTIRTTTAYCWQVSHPVSPSNRSNAAVHSTQSVQSHAAKQLIAKSLYHISWSSSAQMSRITALMTCGPGQGGAVDGGACLNNIRRALRWIHRCTMLSCYTRLVSVYVCVYVYILISKDDPNLSWCLW